MRKGGECDRVVRIRWKNSRKGKNAQKGSKCGEGMRFGTSECKSEREETWEEPTHSTVHTDTYVLELGHSACTRTHLPLSISPVGHHLQFAYAQYTHKGERKVVAELQRGSYVSLHWRRPVHLTKTMARVLTVESWYLGNYPFLMRERAEKPHFKEGASYMRLSVCPST